MAEEKEDEENALYASSIAHSVEPIPDDQNHIGSFHMAVSDVHDL